MRHGVSFRKCTRRAFRRSINERRRTQFRHNLRVRDACLSAPRCVLTSLRKNIKRDCLAFHNYDACSMGSSDNHSPSYMSGSPQFRTTAIEELTPIVSSPGSSSDHFGSQASNSPPSRAQGPRSLVFTRAKMSL